jgi:DNA-binding XRE family transcriptional regulator
VVCTTVIVVARYLAADSILMFGAYGWAFGKPVRKLYCNITITSISVVVALVVGGIEGLGLLEKQLQRQAAPHDYRAFSFQGAGDAWDRSPAVMRTLPERLCSSLLERLIDISYISPIRGDLIDMSYKDPSASSALPILFAPELGKAFRRERKAQGRTQQWVAEKAGVTRFTITQLESGQNVGLHHVLAALTALGKGLSIVSVRPDYDQIKEIFRDDE